MTVPMDCSISYAAGGFFALSSSEAIRSDPEEARRSLRRGRIFTALVTLPIGGYFWRHWPDWSFMYLAGDGSDSPPAGVGVLCCYAAAHELGFRSTARAIRAGRTRLAAFNALVSCALFWVVLTVGWKRFRWQGTRDEYRSGTARDALKSADFMVPFSASVVCFFLGACLVVAVNLLGSAGVRMSDRSCAEATANQFSI